MQCLHSPHGIVYLAAKKHYFGVGGGSRRFISIVEKDGALLCLLLLLFLESEIYLLPTAFSIVKCELDSCPLKMLNYGLVINLSFCFRGSLCSSFLSQWSTGNKLPTPKKVGGKVCVHPILRRPHFWDYIGYVIV